MDNKRADTNAATLEAYEAAAGRYAAHQAAGPPPAVEALVAAFVALLPVEPDVLEIGSATGQDAQLFEALGVRVQRSDATLAFVNALRDRGFSTSLLNVLTADSLGGPWDGIWANAVFLHFDAAEFAGVLAKAADATTAGGSLAFTVKEGDGAGWSSAKLDRPRFYTYWREPVLRALIEASPWRVVAIDHVAGRSADWLFCLLSRESIHVD